MSFPAPVGRVEYQDRIQCSGQVFAGDHERFARHATILCDNGQLYDNDHQQPGSDIDQVDDGESSIFRQTSDIGYNQVAADLKQLSAGRQVSAIARIDLRVREVSQEGIVLACQCASSAPMEQI